MATASEGLGEFTEQPAGRSGGTWRDAFPDPRAMVMILRRNLWVFLTLFVLIALNVAIWTWRQTPIYSSTASVLVEPRGSAVLNTQNQNTSVSPVTPDLPATTDIVDTEVRLMQSTALAKQVAVAYDKLHPGAIKDAGGLNALADDLLDKVSFDRSGGTYVIDVRSRTPSRDDAASLPNLFAHTFVDMDRASKQNASTSAETFLDARTRELAADATSADAALQQYRVAHGLISGTNTPLSEQELSSINSEIAQAEADLAEKQGRLAAARDQLQHGGGGADVGAALGSGTIGTLRGREAEASATVAQLESHYGPRYPDLIKARSDLAAVRGQIQLEIDRIVSNLSADVRVAQSRLASLQESRGRSVSTLANNNSASVGLDALQRHADAAKNIYETFLRRAHEIRAQDGLQQADVRVAEEAQLPDLPIFPNYKLAALLALLGGALGGLAGIAASEYLQGGVRTKEDVERRLRLRYAGTVPSLKSTLSKLRQTEPPHDYIVSHPLSAFAESFRALRAFLLLGSGAVAGSARSVAVASALPREGKTTTAVCLARTAAMAGTRTVLVDCDLRRRNASELVGGGTNGLYDYLSGAPLEGALHLDEQSGLYVLAVGEIKPTNVDPFTNENMQQLLSELKRTFQVVILDTAPVLGVADARVVAASADRVLIVTHWRKTSIRACEGMIDILLNAGAKISGLALTQVNVNRYASTGHGDSSGYQRKFKGYYVN